MSRLISLNAFMQGDYLRLILQSVNLLLVAFVPAYVIMRWREKDLDEESRDHQMGLKSILLLFQVLSFQLVLFGLFLFFDWIFGKIGSEGISSKAMRGGIGLIVGGAAFFLGLEILLAQTNNAKKWYPRKVWYGINLILTLVYAVIGVVGFLGSLVSWASGAAFHVPLTLLLIYTPAAGVLALIQLNVFGDKEAKGALAGGLIGLGGSKLQAFSDQAGAGMAAASASMDEAASQGGGMPQPVGQPQPVSSAPSMGGGSPSGAGPAVGAAHQAAEAQQGGGAPASGGADPANCPTCGGQTRFIAQYNRTWCDTCQRYL